MSKDKLEVGDIWESDNYEIIITKTWGGDDNSLFAKTIIRNKRNGGFSEEDTNLRDLKQYQQYKGKAKHQHTTWFEVVK